MVNTLIFLIYYHLIFLSYNKCFINTFYTLHFQLLINYLLPESSWQSGLSSKCLTDIAIQMFIFLSTSFYTNVFSLDLFFAASLLISQVTDGALGNSVNPSSLLWFPFFHYIPEYSILFFVYTERTSQYTSQPNSLLPPCNPLFPFDYIWEFSTSSLVHSLFPRVVWLSSCFRVYFNLCFNILAKILPLRDLLE